MMTERGKHIGAVAPESFRGPTFSHARQVACPLHTGSINREAVGNGLFRLCLLGRTSLTINKHEISRQIFTVR